MPEKSVAEKIDEFFAGHESSRPLFEALRLVVGSLGDVDLRVTKSQIAFAHKRAFAWAWVPARYLGSGHAPLVLSVALPHPDPSPRWKQVVEPSPGHFMHHLELRSESDIDDEVRAWLQQARAVAENGAA